MSYLDVLANKNMVSLDDLAILEGQAQKTGKNVDELLEASGVNPIEILKAKGEYYNLPVREKVNPKVPFEVLNYIPEESVHHYGIVPLGVVDGILEVGTVEPENLEARDALQFIASRAGLPYKVYLITSNDFEAVLAGYKGLSGEVTKALSELELELSADEQELSKTYEALANEPDQSGQIIEDAPVTKIVATILRYAIEGLASDIHIEPMGSTIRVRFRVDGTLYTSLTLPLKVHQAVVARVKILSNMKLDEKRKPQDNRFSAHISGRKIDFRVSTFPTYYGEKIVMRILDPEKGVKKLDDLGLTPENMKLIRSAIKRPYGMILISGPTGSGKTTTLYSMLSELDRDKKNVLSLEDPVEYNVPGMSQSQMRPDIGYTFAHGLRTTLRQDPDIIMVGEIRDSETAGLAIQAALTGHLVLSTIHTNDAAGVIPRLIDMGVAPYLIGPTLVLAIAQRLVKTLCPGGGEPVPVEGSIRHMIEDQFSDLPEKYRKKVKIGKEVYKIKATAECPSGTKGRMAVFEVIEMARALEETVLEKPTAREVMKAARKEGMLSMKEDALLKAFNRLIPFEEVNALGVVYEEEGETADTVPSKKNSEDSTMS